MQLSLLKSIHQTKSHKKSPHQIDEGIKKIVRLNYPKYDFKILV